MKGGYVLSPLAQRDLDIIWDYTVEKWGKKQAIIYTRQLQKHIELIAAKPLIAKDCSEIRRGYYKYPSGSHLLFFRLIDGGIDVVRILHQQMDWEQHII